ncbi:hypothetical protein THAOC_05218, partial [Thalassiosira oceanica]
KDSTTVCGRLSYDFMFDSNK